jgi:4-hydroxyphenylpyruvate dioxygenase
LYKGLETGERNIVCHVVKNNDIVFAFKSPLNPNDAESGAFLSQHGDFVKDVAFSVSDLDYIVEQAEKRGAKIVKPIWKESDENGSVRMAVIQSYGDVTHTLIERQNYKGEFLPGFKKHYANDPLEQVL